MRNLSKLRLSFWSEVLIISNEGIAQRSGSCVANCKPNSRTPLSVINFAHLKNMSLVPTAQIILFSVTYLGGRVAPQWYCFTPKELSISAPRRFFSAPQERPETEVWGNPQLLWGDKNVRSVALKFPWGDTGRD